MPSPIAWVSAFAQQRGLRYEPEADERWLRAWEPYTTLRVPIRYEHALHATGATGSISIARAVMSAPAGEVGTWIAIVQDERLRDLRERVPGDSHGLATRIAITSDFATPFAESIDMIALARQATGDAAFDRHFATFAASAEEAAGITPSLRKLLFGWGVPVHAEMRPGGFVLAPVTVPPDPGGLAWMLDAVHLFGAKSTKQGMLPRNIGS